jgi:hypothetical protein
LGEPTAGFSVPAAADAPAVQLQQPLSAAQSDKKLMQDLLRMFEQHSSEQ